MRKLVFLFFSFYLIICPATGALAQMTFHLDFGQDGSYESSWALAGGEEVSIDVYVSNVPEPGLASMGFIMDYDSSKLDVIVQGTAVDPVNWPVNRVLFESGEITMGGGRIGSGLLGDNIKLGTVKFLCIEPGESELKLRDRLRDDGDSFDCFVLANETVLDDTIVNFADGIFLSQIRAGYKGDFDGDGDVNLADAILTLQMLARLQPSLSVRKQADVNGDKKMGLQDAIYILQKVSALR